MPLKRFREVGTVAERTPMGLWGGRYGELDAIYLSTSGRFGGTSRVFRHGKRDPDTVWKDEGVPENAETINKIIDDGEKVYAYFETGGETPVISRTIAGGAGGWAFDGPSTVDFVGGRGLAKNSGGLLVGGSWYWNAGENPDHRKGELFHGSGTRRIIAPGICWEVLVTEDDVIWELWHGVAGSETVAQAFRDGVEIPAPTHSTSGGEVFLGSDVYACGSHEEEVGPPDSNVYHWTGSEWEVVHSTTGIPEHLVWVPRETGDVLYCVAAHPVEVWEFDGSEWLRHDEIPELDTGEDHNHTTALGYHDGRVWFASRDEAGSDMRLWVDAGGGDLLLQVI